MVALRRPALWYSMRQVMYHRKQMGGVNASRENHIMIEKQIRILENRLDKALIRFNEAVSSNKQLRQEIDDLRRERVVFENVYKRLERELQEKKKQMTETIELSNRAYEQRDRYQMEVRTSMALVFYGQMEWTEFSQRT
jgi:chromosome segregation ATPase